MFEHVAGFLPRSSQLVQGLCRLLTNLAKVCRIYIFPKVSVNSHDHKEAGGQDFFWGTGGGPVFQCYLDCHNGLKHVVTRLLNP